MWELVRANRRRAALLVAVMAALMLAVGYAVAEIAAPGAGPAGLALALVIWAVMALAGYFGGDRILLAASRARRIAKQDHPVLWNVVEEMCIASGLSHMPAVYIIDEDAPNAFATGRDPERSAIAVTAGLLERLDRDELQGVVAHELGHVKNRDILYLTMAGILLGTVVILADLGVRMLWFGGGRRRTSSGRRGSACLTRLLTLSAACSTSLPISKVTSISSRPLEAEVDFMYIRSSIPLMAFSSGAATVCSRVSAEAPG